MELRRRLAGAALALRAGDDRRSRPVHRELGPYGDRLEPLPRVGPVRARTLVLRPCKGGFDTGARGDRAALAALPTERAVLGHRPEVRRLQQQRPGPLRRPPPLGSRLDRAAPRPRVRPAHARGGAPLRGGVPGVGARRRGARGELLRDLPRQDPALEHLGRRLAPGRTLPRGLARRAPPARPPAADRVDDPVHVLPDRGLPRRLLARAPAGAGRAGAWARRGPASAPPFAGHVGGNRRRADLRRAAHPTVAEQFEVTVAAHGDGPVRDAAEAAGVRFVPVKHLRRGINPFRDALALVELVRLCRRERPEILHANSSKAGVLGRIAGVLAGVPIRIFTAHGWAFAAYPGLAGWLYLWADRIVQPLTTQVICVAEHERELGIGARSCVPERSVVVHNAVDVGSFAAIPHVHEPPQIISVGRFAYPKDYPTLVDALARIDADYRVTLVGEGPDRPTVTTDARRRLAGRAELVGARRDVRELLAAADLFVLSSRSEALPISVLEAMAAGLPVVATDVGGVSELVVDGETGFLVPPADAKALAQALETLLREPRLRRRFGAAARRRAEQRFDLPRFREAHLRLYRRELELRSRPVTIPPSRTTGQLEPEPRSGEREKRRLADHEQHEREPTRQQEARFARAGRSRRLAADRAKGSSIEH